MASEALAAGQSLVLSLTEKYVLGLDFKYRQWVSRNYSQATRFREMAQNTILPSPQQLTNTSSSSHMRVMSHNWSATKQRLHSI